MKARGIALVVTVICLVIPSCRPTKPEEQFTKQQECDAIKAMPDQWRDFGCDVTPSPGVNSISGNVILAPGAEEATGEVPQGTLIAFSSQNRTGSGGWDIWAIDPASRSDLRRLTSTEEDDWHPLWSPDGSRLVFTRDKPGKVMSLWVVNRDGSGERMVLGWRQYGNGELSPVFWYREPGGGERIYYQMEDSPFINWVYVDGEPSQETHVLEGAEAKVQPGISPDQTRLTLRDYGQGVELQLVGMAQDGRSVIPPFTTLVPSSLSSELLLPQWAPDGSRIAFTGDGLIYTVGADGTGLQQESGFPQQSWIPRWSPDAGWLAVYVTSPHEDIVIGPVGSAGPAIYLTDDDTQDLWPDWSAVIAAR